MASTRSILVILGLSLGLAGPLAAAPVEDWTAVTTRPGVQVDCLVTREPDSEPTRVLLLFTGGEGTVGAKALAKPTANFLVRSRALFVSGDTATAVLNVPSDRPGGITDSFRMSPEHAADIGCVLDFLKTRFPATAEFYLVGTSRGTVSAAYAGRQLQGRLKGIVLTSSVLDSEAQLKSIAIPILLVHHRHDGCKASPYRNAQFFARDLKLPLVTVDGGKPEVTDPCEPGSPHGYWGKEPETVAEILHWVRGEPVKDEI